MRKRDVTVPGKNVLGLHYPPSRHGRDFRFTLLPPKGHTLSFRDPRTHKEQGRIHGNTVADGWAGAVMRKPLGIQQGRIHGHRLRTGGQGRIYAFSHFSTRSPLRTNQPTDRRTDKASYRVACPQLKKNGKQMKNKNG